MDTLHEDFFDVQVIVHRDKFLYSVGQNNLPKF